MYSCLDEISAKDAAEAVANVHPSFGEAAGLAPPVAIHWPVETQEEREWLEKHV